jgi:ribonuclease R
MLNARSVIDLMAVHANSLTWQQIVEMLAAPRPHGVKRVRQILRELVRLGEITANEHRQYSLSSTKRRKRKPSSLGQDAAENNLLSQQSASQEGSSILSGLVTGLGPRLFVDGIPLGKVQRNGISARPNDEISYAMSGEEAIVTRVIKYSSRPLVGILNLKTKFPQVDPLGRSFSGRVRLGNETIKAAHGDTVRVHILNQDRDGLLGELVDVLKADSVIEQAISSTLDSLDIPTDWPDSIDRAVSRLPKRVQLSQYPDRVDLSQTPLVTIDGETAKDFDDAVYAKPLGGRRGWRVIVAIADVAHYVKPNSAFDMQAQHRTTSVYLPNHVVPMLPEGLSNELCSLKPDVYRLALVCEMQVSVKGLVREHKFYEAVIRSHGRLTYEQVQAHLDEGAVLPCKKDALRSVVASLAALKQVFLAFNQAKEDRGGLEFNSREGVIEIEHGHVTGVARVSRLMAHQIIEEAMINANVCAASFIENNESNSLYRVHDKPDTLKLEELRQDLMAIGLRIPEGEPNSTTYKTLLSAIAEKPNGWLYQQLVLRSMKQAVYSPENKGHFGLGLINYMHFTSPIRRYPDLLVHRTIKSILHLDKKRKNWIPDYEQLEALGVQCSNNERRAESAGWTVEAWLKCELLRQHVGESVRGTIATVTEFGLFIEIDKYFVQGLLHISDLGSDYFRYDRRNQCLFGERNGRRFTLGDEIEVLVINVEPPQGKIELRLSENVSRGLRRPQKRVGTKNIRSGRNNRSEANESASSSRGKASEHNSNTIKIDTPSVDKAKTAESKKAKKKSAEQANTDPSSRPNRPRNSPSGNKVLNKSKGTLAKKKRSKSKSIALAGEKKSKKK